MESQKRDLKSDYLQGIGSLRPFYQHAFYPQADYKSVIDARSSKPVDRSLLVKELLAQHAVLPNAEKTIGNVHLLAEANTFTVTTGHQLCWMGGPMYTVYKILSTIKLAQIISKKHPGYNIIPIFWMATEDHDWDEINHFYPDAGRKVIYQAKHKGPVGRHVLESQAQEAFEPTTSEILKQFYQPGISLAQAFRNFIHHLFGKWGLVIVDGDSKPFKKSFTPWMEKELSGLGIADAVQETSIALESAGYQPTAKHRDVNVFFMGHGGRSGILREDGRLRVPDAGIEWSVDQAIAHLHLHPEDFSPNVVFRPLYQEMLLPNLAYVGGWAEMGYWMQLKNAFSYSGVSFPLLVPRMSGTLLLPEMVADAEALGFEVFDFKASIPALQDTYLDRHWDSSALQQAQQAVLHAQSNLIATLETIDPTLAISMKGEQAKMVSNFENLHKKVRKSFRNKDPKPYAKITHLKGLIWPEQEMQERLLNFTAFPGDYQVLIQKLFDACEPEKVQEEWINLA